MQTAGTTLKSPRLSFALLVAPFPVWLQLCALSLAAYQTLVLLALLLAGRGCSTLRYRRIFQFWIVHGLLKATTLTVRELFQSGWQLMSWGQPRSLTATDAFFTRLFVRLHAWLEAVLLLLLVFPIHRGLVDTIAPLLTVGGTSLVEGIHRADATADRTANSSATSTIAPSPTLSSRSYSSVSPEQRTGLAGTVRLRRRRRALAAFHLFELSAWIYQQILLSHLEKIEPEIDLLLGRLRSQLRQAQLAFKELLSFGLAWILANSGHAAEAAMLGNAAVHGAQIGLAERLARVRRTAAALIERAYGSPDAYRLNQGSRQRPERRRLGQLRPQRGQSSVDADISATLNADRAADRPITAFTRHSQTSASLAVDADDASIRGPGSRELPGARSFPAVSVPGNPSMLIDEGFSSEMDPRETSRRSVPHRGGIDSTGQSAAGVDASEERQMLQSLALLPRLVAPFTEPQHFPRSFRSSEEEATRQMYATDDVIWVLSPMPFQGFSERPPNSKSSTKSALWRALSAVFQGTERNSPERHESGHETGTGCRDHSVRPESLKTKAERVSPQPSRDRSVAGDRRHIENDASCSRAFHGSMMLPRPGEYDAPFLDGARAIHPQSRARAYERVRALRDELRRVSRPNATSRGYDSGGGT
ncbi:hypothetical protein CCYA_CCYA07G1985 [Cyanidiococcus yangmingshanensis]|nr:hypothetical protein CCYA_CCYA07G1985 [Cyanidiococcus yangmingshanensis]